MDITLKVEGKPRTYTTGFISARMVRRTVAMTKTVDFENLSPEELDTLVDYVTDIFERQFTRDDLYDGLSSRDLLPTITRCIGEVVGTLTGEPAPTEKNG